MERKQILIDFAYFATIFAICYFGVHYLLQLAMPFVLGFVFAQIVKHVLPLVTKTDNKAKRVIGLILFYLIVVSLCFLIAVKIGNQISILAANLPSFYKNNVLPVIDTARENLDIVNNNLSAEVQQALNNVYDGFIKGLGEIVSNLSKTLLSATKDFVTSIPNIIVSVILTIVSSFYFLLDYEKIVLGVISSLPYKIQKEINQISIFMKGNVWAIIKSYAIIMFITALELFVGLLILRVKSPVSLSFGIAFLDILPVLGVGTILIPWGVADLIMGKIGIGVGLLILYGIITVVRQTIEPKIVGTNLGIHPLLMLVTMILGFKIFGAVGMFGCPLAASYILTFRKKHQKVQPSFFYAIFGGLYSN